MARAPYQVLVFPYRQAGSGAFEYALFYRADEGFWQGIAGGGEDDEAPQAAARREAFEEAGIPINVPLLRLDTVISVPVIAFRDSYLWGDDIYVIPQFCFGAQVQNHPITLSREHTEFRWQAYDDAYQIMGYDGDRVALCELHQRVRGLGPRDY
jgi:dATP pyrophosphohydrolase